MIIKKGNNTEYICDICGKHFRSEYYTGGYIDHVNNFVGNKRIYEKDLNRCLETICFQDGLRESGDIIDRLNCFLKWDGVSDEDKQMIAKKCNKLLEKISKAEEKATILSQNLTMLERRYLIKKLQDNLHTPHGNEDGKLWD